jgi:hypothetical protein
VRTDLAEALQPAFLAAAAVCLVLFVVVVLALHEVPLRRGFDDSAPEAAEAVSPQRVQVRG